jgi:protein-disulfide isomerase
MTCPDTRLSRGSIRALQYECGGELTFVFRHFPLEEIHAHACAASAAAEAAAAQGEFWAMHEYLFEHPHAVEDADLRQYARHFRLDPDRFGEDRTAPQTAERIARDQVSGEPTLRGVDSAGVEGSPTFYVNGVRHDGPFDVASLRAAVPAHRLS